MTLATWLATLKTRLAHHQPRRTGRRHASPKPATAKLRVDQLEERLLLSGFGPEDGSYIVESWSGSYTDVKIQPIDQKIVAAGTFPGPGVAIARYDTVGNPDSSYGNGGLSTTTAGYAGSMAGLALQPDGKAVVAAKKTSGYFGAARFSTNGSLDSGFGSGGWSGVNVPSGDNLPPGFGQISTGVGLQSNGRIVVGGLTAGFNDPWARSAVLARFKTNGATDSGNGGFGIVVKGKSTGYAKETFGAKLAEFQAVAIQPDDKVVAVGDFSPAGSATGQLIVARFTATGILDTSFNGSGYSVLNLPGISYTSTPIGGGQGVALQSDGKIIVVSTCSGMDGPSDMLVARYNTNGTLDTSFGGGSGYVRLDIDGTVSPTFESGVDVTIQPDGKIVAVGQQAIFIPGGGAPGNVLVSRLNPDGTPDSNFGSGGFKIGAPPTGADYHSFRARGVALQSDGSIIIAGIDYQGSNSTNAHPLLMRFLPTPASPLQATGGTASARSHTEPLTLAQVQPLLTEAVARWQTAGMDVSALGGIDIRIADLGGSTLGLASGSTIWLDDNAAGWGWFVDATPWDDSEFTKRGNQGENDRMDLLTVLDHEIGHLLGFDHSEVGVMGDTLDSGVRRMPAAENVRTEPVVVDTVLALDSTGQHHRRRDDVSESLIALIGRFNRVGLGRENTLRR